MDRTLAQPALTIALLALLLGVSPAQLAAQDATPPATVSNASATTSDEMCSAVEIAFGEQVVVEAPHDTSGVVQPAADPTMELWVVVVTLPPGSCVGYHSHAGAVVLFVQQGTIEYAYRPLTGEPDLGVAAGDRQGVRIPLSLGTPVLLTPGAWVTQDREVEYTYRNAGEGDAVVALSAYVDGDTAAVPSRIVSVGVLPLVILGPVPSLGLRDNTGDVDNIVEVFPSRSFAIGTHFFVSPYIYFDPGSVSLLIGGGCQSGCKKKR